MIRDMYFCKASSAKCDACNVLISAEPVAWESSEVILEHVPASAVLAYWTVGELCKPTSDELQTFRMEDDHWKAARWASGEHAVATTIIEWAHWFELHDFVNGKSERPSWLPM